MRCAGCGRDNPDDDRFCGICGEPLAPMPRRNTHGDAPGEAAATSPICPPVAPPEGARANFMKAGGQPARAEQATTFELPAAEGEENTPAGNGPSNYPFDDEEVHTSRFAKYVSLIALLILGVLIVKEWGPLKQQVANALGFASPATRPATAPISQPPPTPVQDAAGENPAAGGGSSTKNGQPQATLPAQPAPRKARPVAAIRSSAQSQRGKAFKRQSGQPQRGRRRRTRERNLISAGRQPGT